MNAADLLDTTHLVQLYEDDAFLVETVSAFLAAGLDAGRGAVVIAMRDHLQAIVERLGPRADGQLVVLDASDALARIMVDGQPDAQRFTEVVGGAVEGARRGREPRVQAYGEMVTLLWAEGNRDAVIRLEALWNDLATRQPLSLMCGYPLRGFQGLANGPALAAICSQHTGVLPAGSFTGLTTAEERLRMIAALQQKASSLETEIAERRQVEAALQHRERELAELLQREKAARSQAETLLRSKDEFLAVLSHELRTPLSAMLGWVRMLRGGMLDSAAAARALEVIERNTHAQTRLINDLLDMSRIITGKLRLDVQLIDLAALIREALETVRPAAEAKGIRLAAALDPVAGPIVGDPDRLQQILWNLLSNAVKYTPKGGRVDVTLARVSSRTRITVKDTGVGIRPEFLPHIFDRFSQAETGPARTHSGLGLGLAIVRHLVELHGGTVRAASAGEETGSTFTVELPVSTFSLAPGQLDDYRVQRGHDRTLDGVRVLVVDDQADARDLLALILSHRGAAVSAVATVSEALAAIDRGEPDVLVSDIGLAGESGYDLIRAVRSRPQSVGRVPAVAVTAYSRDEDRQQALAAGFQAHLGKPFEPERIVEAVARLAGKTSKV